MCFLFTSHLENISNDWNVGSHFEGFWSRKKSFFLVTKTEITLFHTNKHLLPWFPYSKNGSKVMSVDMNMFCVCVITQLGTHRVWQEPRSVIGSGESSIGFSKKKKKILVPTVKSCRRAGENVPKILHSKIKAVGSRRSLHSRGSLVVCKQNVQYANRLSPGRGIRRGNSTFTWKDSKDLLFLGSLQLNLAM